jgi:serine/threonine-protein kinase
MEFLDGEDLHRRIARVGRLSPKRTVQIVRQVASALAATHAKQIVHRDLKPANIYLLQIAGEDDFVKVLDFGISKILDANTKITRGTVLMGTPNYMSPEQAMGMAGEVDHRSDQWSLACIAWECLSGASPFVADSVPAMLYQVVHGDPVPFAAPVAGLPHGVHAVLQRALSKNKEERFPSVIEFAQALENAIQGKPAVVQVTEAVTAPVSAAKTEIYEAVPVDTRDKRPAESLAPIAGGIAWSQDRAGRPKWQWAVAGLGVSVIGLATIFALRPTAKERPRSSPISAPGPAFTLPTSAPTATFEPKQGQVPAPLPPAGAGTLPRGPAPDPEETETAQASPDSNVTTPNADGRARPKKAAAGVRMKNKTTRSERRLIKEL